MNKKWISMLLAVLMVLTGSLTAFAEGDVFAPVEEEPIFSENASPARALQERQANGNFDKEDEVRLIVELDTEAFTEFGRSYTAEELRDRSNFAPQEEFARKANAEALRLIEDAGIDFELRYALDILLVGFTGKATFGDALKIADMPFVKRIEIAAEHHAPEVEEIQDRMPKSNIIIGQDDINSEYDGSGTIVAVLDSGADYEHPAFHLGENGKAKKLLTFENQQGLQSFLDEKGVTTEGAYLSEKIPFAYNYFDKNTSVKDLNKDTGMHGQHVAGTIGGNRQVLPSGETFLGVAPETQLLVMRVFGEKIATTGPDVYVPAINDAVKMGAHSIN